MSIPKAILLDLDNTLYPYAPCHEAGLRAACELWAEQGLDPKEQAERYYKQGRDDVHDRLSHLGAGHHRLLYFQTALEKRLGVLDYQLALDLNACYWDAFMGAIRLFPGAMEWLEALKRADIPVVLVTDLVAQTQFEKIERMGLSHLLPLMVTSEEAGEEKPSHLPFERALMKVHARADARVWMIGDSYKKDIVPAKRLGLSTVHIVAGLEARAKESEEEAADHIFERFDEFQEKLGWP